MTHPLTDELLYEMFLENSGMVFTDDNMRKAADWQLEKVIEWIKGCPTYNLRYKTERRKMLTELEKAMRPQQQENN